MTEISDYFQDAARQNKLKKMDCFALAFHYLYIR